MIKLTVNPSVLEAIRAAFPSPPRSAEKALNSYLKLLEKLLTEAISYKNSSSSINKNIFVLSVDRISQEGPRIGPNKVRLHKWLSEQKLGIIHVLERGNNLTGTKSIIKLTSLAQAIDVFAIQETESAFRVVQNPDISDEYKTQILVDAFYKDFNLTDWNAGNQQQLVTFDVVPVNVDSLNRHLSWLLNKTYKISNKKRSDYAKHAQFIQLVAKHFNGNWPQRKVQSPFGRTYYKGLNVQNINKLLRRAILAPAWEYDLNTSVCAWKLGLFADAKTAKQLYPSLYEYVNHKKDFINSVRYEVFPNTPTSDHDAQRKVIKQAITALSFGAKLEKRGWTDSSGTKRYSAISEILRHYPNAADRFIRSASISGFNHDQQQIDDAVIDQCKATIPTSQLGAHLKTKRDRFSKSKVLSSLYQTAETEIMDELRQFVTTRYRRKVVAKIHDAIVLNAPLGREQKAELTDHLQNFFNNPFLTLKSEQLEQFTNETTDEQPIQQPSNCNTTRV